MFNLVPFRIRGFEDSLWPTVFQEDFFSADLSGFKADISETDQAYLVEAELPGFTKENISVELEKDTLTIRAERNDTLEKKEGNYLRKERRTGQVTRSFVFDNIDSDNVQAEFKEGILRLTIPKLETTDSKVKKIEIN